MSYAETFAEWRLWCVVFARFRVHRLTGCQADEQRVARGEKALKLEETSRLLQKCFSACLNDRCLVPAQSAL